ncbi:transcriptional regulator [Polaribacter phage Danklef_1]|uniref:Transcriptional regulator n=1 Tax=Polaribacter phage Danklef_1 TaxID=2745646 RepID=A0A8E4ZET9_9CAUD|nr:transcriptional regulator [Polaribacter phage Danklef_1]QQV90602.1 transcriptional regulator [Polaribacter phage Danklef_2]QQV90679.1 transcriptional regulator [Polaribacter phage Danklef_3]QQV90755.1 transcriptional regulator [Polaribacter phage Danklef_4]QQV90833.1 transcriptional regulator [Polaribacter phage Danklef_5]QQV90525.1 transcriptional regulator [Polaribacter phage Danklef_1]
MNSYELSRAWFNFSFDNPHKIKPHHSAIYFFAIEHCNRLGWKKVFGFPTSMVLDAIGMKSYGSYKKYLDELVDFGFIKVHEYSKNQYSANIIELTLNVKALDKAHDKALDKALIKHGAKQRESTEQSTSESIDSINKQLTNKQLNKRTIKPINNTLLSKIKISDVPELELEYFQIAKAFQDLFIKNLKEKNTPSKNQENAKYRNYVDPIRLMMKNDGITKEQITIVFQYLNSSRCENGDFSWKTNILSTSKLREKFTQLLLKSQLKNGKSNQETRTNKEIATAAFNSDTAKQFRFK